MKDCPNCKGEGFFIIEDVENHHIRECELCKGVGVVNS